MEFENSVFKFGLTVLVLVLMLACAIAVMNGTGITGVVDTLRGIWAQLVSIFNQLH